MAIKKALINSLSIYIILISSLFTITSTLSCKEDLKPSTTTSFVENNDKPKGSSLTRKKVPVITRKGDLNNSSDKQEQLPETKTELPAVKIKKSKDDTSKPALKPAQGKTDALSDERILKYRRQKQDQESTENYSTVTIPDHSLFSEILQKVVDKNGLVNYNLLKKNIKSLQNYTDYLSSIDETFLINKQEKKAFWINAYNAFTLLMVVKNYPITSIRDLSEGKPWDQKWITINNNKYSLNQIKNDILRKYFFDPRLHFVLSDGSRSGPGLNNKAYTGVLLEPMLEARTMSFINGPLNEINPDQMELNQIFDIYRQDFGRLIPYISRYAVVKPKLNTKISFQEYDWRLNKQ